MDAILAKSKPTETLEEHVTKCCQVLQNLRKDGWGFDSSSQAPSFYTDLFYVIVLHDMGKAIDSMQRLLRGKEKMPGDTSYRHEMISAGFVHALQLPDARKQAIFLAVLTHHKNLDRFLPTVSDGFLGGIKTQSGQDREFFQQWRSLLPRADLLQEYWERMFRRAEQDFGINADAHRLDVTAFIREWAEDEGKYPTPHAMASQLDQLEKRIKGKYPLFLKGVLQTCDHLASGGIVAPLAPQPDLFQREAKKLSAFQERAASVCGSTILVAPTGSGKTLAALAWAKNNYVTGAERLFYILPYVASNNAMYRRFVTMLEEDNDKIGMLHGQAIDFFFHQELENLDPHQATESAKRTIWRSKDLYRPYKIMTLYQLVAPWFYARGYEQRLSELLGSLVIIDEVHAYDVQQTAQLLWVLKQMQRLFGAKVMVMTATLPTFLQKLIAEKLQIPNQSIIKVEEEKLLTSCRHRVVLREGTITDYLGEIESLARAGTRVLIVCNTVQSAIDVYKQLRGSAGDRKIKLLHSKFAVLDRRRIEDTLKNEDILVATQAVEVSLNISYDVLFSEPAPIDALLQRFGRINRFGEKQVAPVYVCREEIRQGPYGSDLINRTLNALEPITELRERLVQPLLDEVYGDQYSREDQELFDITWDALDFVAGELVIGHKDQTDHLREKFDGVEVVPSYYEAEWRRAMEEKNPLQASQYEVRISLRQFSRLKRQGQIVEEPDNERTALTTVSYSPETGLDLAGFIADDDG